MFYTATVLSALTLSLCQHSSLLAWQPVTDLGDKTASPGAAATLMVYKYFLQRPKMVRGVAGWLWALLWLRTHISSQLAFHSLPLGRRSWLKGQRGTQDGQLG